MTNKEYVIPEVKKTLNDENFKIWRDELHTNFVKKIGEMERKDGTLCASKSLRIEYSS